MTDDVPRDASGSALLRAVAVMDRLRAPGGCPWDAEQTHASLAPYAVEEAHELAEAAESGTAADLREELGDLLLQVLFHARIAAERADGFDIDDVAATLVDKLTYRHPHVFADDGERDLSAQQVTQRWEELKAAQQQRTSVLEGIPVTLPALARAQKVLSRVDKAGLTLEPEPEPEPALDAQPEPDAETSRSLGQVSEHPESEASDRPEGQASDAAAAIGDQLLDLIRVAHRQGVDAEAALRARIRELEEQVRRAER